MRLHKRDYRFLTPEEDKTYKALLEKEKVNTGSLRIIKSQWLNYPEAARKYISLFPNNYLDPLELKEVDTLNGKLEEFKDLLNKKETSEQDILNFINKRSSHFIIGSLLSNGYDFGHHDAYIFPEFKLGISYEVDFLLIGKNSGGYEFVFVELEDPQPGSVLKNGDHGSAVRKGLSQIQDWKIWVEAHFGSLQEFFFREKQTGYNLEKEFSILDLSRIHFCLIAGRRQDYKERTYRLRRDSSADRIKIIHYDNLVFEAESIVGKLTY